MPKPLPATGAFGEDMHFGVQARVLPVGELVLWYRMFAPYGRFLGTTAFARGAPLRDMEFRFMKQLTFG